MLFRSVTGAWESIKLLGAVSGRGETFLLPCEENFNSDTAIRLVDALQTEFGEKIRVVLDNASYFTANAVQEFVEDTLIELCYLPGGSPELNPVEECWRQLNQALATACSTHWMNFRRLHWPRLAISNRRMSSRT